VFEFVVCNGEKKMVYRDERMLPDEETELGINRFFYYFNGLKQWKVKAGSSLLSCLRGGFY